MTVHDRVTRGVSTAAVGLSYAFTGVILILLFCVLGYLLTLGAGSISLDFFTQLPKTDTISDAGGMKQALVGTGILIGLASVIGIPVGMLTGVYLSEYDTGSKLATPVRFVCDVLAGVPSIVVGILGYELLVRPLYNWDGTLTLFGHVLKVVPNGNYNGYAGSFALAFIMIPIVARTTEEMLRLVPGSYREASMALGSTKAQTILNVVLPAATGSLVTGVMLAIARVAGETAPLLFTALGSRLMTVNPREPMPSLTAQIYQYTTGTPEQIKLAWGGVLVLIALIFALNLAIRFAAGRRGR